MNRPILVVSTGLIAIAIFAAGTFFYLRTVDAPSVVASDLDTLVRAHSPVIGPAEAPVTIVEFIDPSCEACRAFYPIVKQILAEFSNDVRLVLRYAPFHEGSDQAVKIIEAARIQGKFEPVLEAVFAQQPDWAVHSGPRLDKLWEIAATAGLDTARARADLNSAAIARVLEQDFADVRANKVEQTPTFFVNGKPLPSFGPQQLYDLVRSEVEQP